MRPTLYLLSYCNYYNRIVKKENSLQDYQPYVLGYLQDVINWNPNDGISTKQVINWSNDTPDYVIVVDEEGQIDSRWFVLEATRTRAMQLELTLYRDTVVDFYDDIINAPCFIEKATPQSIRDPAIYNSENMTFNQIKTGEQLLFDETKCPWIVGYIPRDSFKTDTTVSVDAQLAGSSDITVDTLSDYPFYQYNNAIVNGQVTNPTIKIRVTYWLMKNGQSYYYLNQIKVNQDGTFIGMDKGGGQTQLLGYTVMKITDNPLYVPQNEFTEEYGRKVASRMPELAEDFKNLSDYVDGSNITPEEYNQLVKDNGKIIYETSTGKYWKVKLVGTSSSSGTTTTIPWSSSLGIKMQNTVVKEYTDGKSLGNPILPDKQATFVFTSDTSYQKLTFEPVDVKLSVKVPATRYQASESPYDIFCMPYSNNLTIKKDGQVYIQNTSASSALILAQQIAAEVGKDNVYDIQLLPYCPVRYCIQEDGSFDIGSALYTDVTADTEKVSVLLWATSDNFQLTIPISIPEAQTVLDKKIKTETEFIRIVSPNYSNSFEFDPQMNEGLEYVKVLCHYKPFNPYIKVQPNFKGMYGTDFNDARGLICNGDFSLAQITSAWADYELQNKNYQAMFNREIQNIKVNNSVQREQEIWSIATGVLGGGGAGAAAGSMIGGPVGAAAGGILGAGASLAGGLKDLELNDKLRNEALDYKKDMFGYSLQNIQALPYGLAKTSAISPDNKFVPFIEYYQCTDIERQALEDKLKYNGYTIMRIGTISNFLQQDITYIKGKLIRLEGISDDYHMLNSIAGELDKGVFI